MKKINTRSVLLALLISASLLCYIFIRSVSVESTPGEVSDKTEIEIEPEENDKDQEIILPDVRLIKELMKLGNFLHG